MHDSHTPGPWRPSPPGALLTQRRECSTCGAWEERTGSRVSSSSASAANLCNPPQPLAHRATEEPRPLGSQVAPAKAGRLTMKEFTAAQVELEEMLESTRVEPDAEPDDVAALILLRQVVGGLLRRWLNDSEGWILEWFAVAPEERSEIEIGDMVYRPERPGKRVSVRDPRKALRAVAEEAISDRVLEAVMGDYETAVEVLDLVATLADEALGKNAIRPGAAAGLLGDDFEEHFEVSWPDKLSGHEAGKKLGVANKRFVEAALRRKGLRDGTDND